MVGCALLAALATARANTVTLTAAISGIQEVPPVNSGAAGSAVMHFNPADLSYTLTVNLVGLENELTMSHIHEAPVGANGPVVNNLGGAEAYLIVNDVNYIGTFSGTYAGDVAALLANGAYLNFHTDAYPGGEIRGQLFVDSGAAPTIKNLSTRGFIDPTVGERSVLIGGFVIEDHPVTLLLRGTGPSLGPLGVQEPISDPLLVLYDNTGTEITRNDNWSDGGQGLAISSTGFAPNAETESGILMSFAPGIYTFHLRSKGEAGIGLAEIYNVGLKNVVDSLVSADDFETLVTAVIEAGLAGVLIGPGPYTVFAPTDEAFAALPDGTLEDLLTEEGLATLTNILLYHVVPASVFSGDLVSGEVETFLGATLDVVVSEDGVTVNGASVVEADFSASNGVIHVIDQVLLPPEAPPSIVEAVLADDDFSVLATALGATGLDEVLAGEGPFTVFAPTNAAFDALPEGTLDDLLGEEGLGTLSGILLYHVVAGKVMSTDLSTGQVETVGGALLDIVVSEEGVTVNGAMVTTADIEVANGVIHIIDAVLLPPEPQSILDAVLADEDFSTLATALAATGLDEVLAGEGPFTVFAPTNAAFAALPEGALDELLAEEGLETLSDILLYHVVAGLVLSTDLETGMVETVNGKSIEVVVGEEGITINGALVITADIEVANGVIHIIEEVLIPPADTITEAVLGAENFTTLAAALLATGLDEVLAGEGPFTVFAPTDDAFDALPEGTLEDLLAEEGLGTLTDILRYHVVAGLVFSTDLETGTVTTVLGETLDVVVSEEGVTVNGAIVLEADIELSNGVVHVIDAVLLPPAEPEE